MADFSDFSLVYQGLVADRRMLDLYDASRSYYGFARVIAILGHYYSTGEIVSQAPKADIELYLGLPAEGSFKQTVYAAVAGAIIATPFTTFVDHTLRSWLPASDKEMQRVINLLEEQNKLLRTRAGAELKKAPEEPTESHIRDHKTKMDVIRSITSNSFREIFRPVGRSANTVEILAGPDEKPIGIVDEETLRLIESDVPDENESSVEGTVNSFSRSSLTGIIFSSALGRGFRFEYVSETRLPRGDIFSWSQYSGRPIRTRGRFIKFFDGTIKKFEIYAAERVEDKN
jgi:hypothetical protein